MRPTVDLTATAWRFPVPTVRRLTNGLTVWHFFLPSQPVVAFELRQPIRLTDEPRHIEGVAAVTVGALDEQTCIHPDIQDRLERCGASIHGSAQLYSTRVSGLVPAHRATEFWPLLQEILTEPAFNPDDIALHVEAQEASYRTRLTSTEASARWAFRQVLYGDQRAGRPFCGSPATLGNCTPEAVTAWHRAQFAPTDTTLIVAGDLPVLDEALLESWNTSAERSPALPPALAKPRVVVVDVPDAVQATIVVGLRSVARNDPSWAAARLAGHVLAGGFASRINLDLRERRGYTYSVGGGFEPDPVGSTLQISLNARTDVVGDCVRRLSQHLALETPITDEELTDAKAYRIGIAPLANETSADIAAQAAALADSGLQSAFVDEHTAALARVTSDEASDVWRSLVDPKQLVITVAGKATPVINQLANIGYTPEQLLLGDALGA